jgi:hypothetical protein
LYSTVSRTILWEQLLRGTDGYGGDCSGEEGDDEGSDEEEGVGSLDGGFVDGIKRARVLGVWRRTSADPEVVGRLCRAALERAEQVRQSSSETPLDTVQEEMEGLTESISPRTRALPPLPEDEGEQEDGVEVENVEREHGTVEERLDDFLAKGTEKKEEMLEQLRALAMEAPTFDPKCTCAAKCHCIYGASDRRISRPAASALTIRAEAAGLPPTDGTSPTSQNTSCEPRLDLGWYDRKPTSKGKMPEGKRDSTRPKENELPAGSDEPSPRSSTASQSNEGLQRESKAVVAGHPPTYKH